jgi:hypothetical protein
MKTILIINPEDGGSMFPRNDGTPCGSIR